MLESWVSLHEHVLATSFACCRLYAMEEEQQMLAELLSRLIMQKLHHMPLGKFDHPPVLITAASEDDRVPVWMPAKWVASLRKKSSENSKVLFNIESGGHFLSHADDHRLSATEIAFLLNILGPQR